MQKSFFERISVPLSGVMLSFAAFGNFIRNWSEPVWLVCEIVAGILFLTLIMKVILDPKDIRKTLSNPVGAGIICTFSMGTLFFSVSVKSVSPVLGQIIWSAAVILHIFFMINYTIQLMRKPAWKNLYTVSFLAYVGIAAAAATSPAFGFETLGTAFLIFATAAMLILFPLNIYRYSTIKSPEAIQPLICIFAAPLSLCLVAYLQVSSQKNLPLILLAVTLTVGLYIFALIEAIYCIGNGKFYPSFSAFTFPFINTAIAAFQSSRTLKAAGLIKLAAAFRGVAIPEMSIDVLLVLFVLSCYVRKIIVLPLMHREISGQTR
jgi:exfoliative toxin A/B